MTILAAATLTSLTLTIAGVIANSAAPEGRWETFTRRLTAAAALTYAAQAALLAVAVLGVRLTVA